MLNPLDFGSGPPFGCTLPMPEFNPDDHASEICAIRYGEELGCDAGCQDPSRNKGSGGVTTGGGRVWAGEKAVLLAASDPGTNRVVEVFGPPAGSGAVRVAGDFVWLTAYDIRTACGASAGIIRSQAENRGSFYPAAYWMPMRVPRIATHGQES